MTSHCRVCRFEMVLDDVAVAGESAWLVCLRCFLREIGDARPMPKGFRRELTAIRAGVHA